MSDVSKLFEDTKREIRSVLLTSPRGCELHKFCRDYAGIVGSPVPFKAFGCNKIEEFLHSIPDVVTMQWYPQTASYLLTAVADKSTKHIEKLVSKQKVSKQKTPILSKSKRPLLYLPPRLRQITQMKAFVPATFKLEVTQLVKDYPDGIMLTNFMIAYNRKFGKYLNFEKMGFNTLESCLSEVPGLKQDKLNGDHRVYMPNLSKIGEAPPRPVKATSMEPRKKSGTPPASSGTDFRAPRFLAAGYSKPDATTTAPPPITSASSVISETIPKAAPVVQKSSSKVDTLDIVTVTYDDSFGEINENMKQNFRHILKDNPHGVWCAELPKKYEDFTGNKLELSEMGYFSLIELVDRHPDIFMRVQPEECRSDWLLFGANGPKQSLSSLTYQFKSSDASASSSPLNKAYLDSVISNVRSILQGYPEGVFVDDFIHLYSLNCESALTLKELKHSSIETFLLSIADRVPLTINYADVRKKVYFGYQPISLRPKIMPPRSTGLYNQIPVDAVTPGRFYEWQKLPPGVTDYIPIYIATITNPDLLWIQLRGETTSVALAKLMEELDVFYSSQNGDHYVMQECHTVIGAVCAGIWSLDGAWHRISIIGVSTGMSYVDAIFVDYGTKEKVMKKDLRFLKEDFLKLPAQAVKVRMAYLEPAIGDSWDPLARVRLLNICQDKAIMAQIIDDPYHPNCPSMFLCDVTGDDDLYLHQLLIKEGYARDRRTNATENVLADQMSPPQFNGKPTFPSIPGVGLPSLPVGQSQEDLIKVFSMMLKVQAAASSINNCEGFLNLMMHAWNLNTGNNNIGAPTGYPGFQLPSSSEASSLHGPFPATSSLFTDTAAHGGYPSQYSMVGAQASHVHGIPSSANMSSISCSDRQSAPVTFPTVQPPRTVSGQIFGAGSGRTAYPDISKQFIRPPVSPSEEAITNSVVKGKSSGSVDDSDSGEIFDDDDDEDAFEKFCAECGVPTPRYVRRINLHGGYRIHIILVEGRGYVSGGDISNLFWGNEDSGCLSRRLQCKDIAFATITIRDDEYPGVFHQMKCFQVKGLKIIGEKLDVVLYPLKNVVDILGIFGHSSPTIYKEIEREIRIFNPMDDIWKEFSEDDVESDDEVLYENESDKFQKMCLYDLKATLEGLQFRRLKLMKELGKSKLKIHLEEIKKIESQHKKYEKRIKEIEEISKAYRARAAMVNEK